MKKFYEYLAEAAEGPRIPHPEDSIFSGSAEAAKYLAALNEVMQNPQKSSIKWDGGIALYFGRDQQGQFFVTDKYMPAKGVYPTSPEGWIEYDRARGADRTDLYDKIKTIWSGLEAAVGNTTGTFKGDLMSVGQLQPVDGKFVFVPTTVEYRIPVDSQLGKLIAGKVGVVVVHKYQDRPWDGRTGLTNAGNVAILPPAADLTFKLTDVPALSASARQAADTLKSQGNQVDQFLQGIPGVARVALQTYTNKYITGQTKDSVDVWLRNNISDKQFQFLVGDDNNGYLVQNKAGLNALFNVWNAMYQYKVNLVNQFESQIQGFEQYINGQPGGEGFVFPSSHGLIKLVNRQQFGGAHFAKQR